MASADQFTVSQEELVILIVKDANVYEGLWELTVTFTINVGGVKLPNMAQRSPGVTIAIPQFGIKRRAPNAPTVEGQVVVNAAVVNPKK